MSQDEAKIPVDTPPQQREEEKKSSATYKAGCHCGYIKFSVTLTPPLPQTEVLNCNCSACTRFGYLLVCELFSLCLYLLFQLLLSKIQGQEKKRRQGQGEERETKAANYIPDPEASSVTWHNDSRARCSNYRFNTKNKDQMFCKHCGASIGIDFREVYKPKHIYGISVSSFSPSLYVLFFLSFLYFAS